MKTNVLLSLVLFLAFSSAAAAEWIPLVPDQPAGSPPEISLLSCNAQATQVEILLPGFYVESTTEGIILEVPGWPMTQEVGMPHLPCAAFLVALPDNQKVVVECVGSESFLFEGLTIRPTPEPTFDFEPEQPAPAQPFQGAYPSIAGEPLTPGCIAALPVTAVRAYPFRFEPGRELLSVSARMTVTILHDHGLSTWPAVPLSDLHMRRCQSTVVNFAAVPSVPKTSFTRGGGDYVVITKSSLVSAIEPLVAWRGMSGYNVEIRTVSGASQQDVKNIILEYPNIEYALIVGEASDVPMANWGGVMGDHWYACTTGGGNPDLYADFSIGRLSGSTAARITHQVDKILDYEKDPPIGSWLKHTVLVAHGENYPGKYTACKNTIYSNMASWSDWTVEKCFGGESGVNNAMASGLFNAGTNIINYRGHGGVTDWWSWNTYSQSYYNSDVMALTNGEMRPIVFNIACYNGDISSDCLCEAWLDAPGGATAALGATDPSYTEPNHDFDEALYEAVFKESIRDIGGMLDFADDRILSMGGGLAETNVKMYLWCGDPAMKVWLDIPTTGMDAAYNATINTGMQMFDVYVEDNGTPLQGATVGVFKTGEVAESGVTGSDGHAILAIWPMTPGNMTVGVTHGTYLPIEGSVTVQSMPGPIPNIKIEGKEGPLNVSKLQTVDITVSVDPAGQTGTPCDWWLYGVQDQVQTYWYSVPNSWQATQTLAYSGPLVPLNDYLVTKGKIPMGNWVFVFAIDEQNGSFEGSFVDMIEVRSW